MILPYYSAVPSFPAYISGSLSTLADGNTNYCFRLCFTYSSLVVLFLAFMVFCLTCLGQYLIKDLRVPLQISRTLYLCGYLFSDNLLRVFSCSSLSLRQPICLDSSSLHSLFCASELGHLLVFLLSGITVLHRLLPNVWKPGVSYIFLNF